MTEPNAPSPSRPSEVIHDGKTAGDDEPIHLLAVFPPEKKRPPTTFCGIVDPPGGLEINSQEVPDEAICPTCLHSLEMNGLTRP